MWTQSVEEPERYEARRKQQLDYTSAMKAEQSEAYAAGHAKGYAEGYTEGRMEVTIEFIAFCERLLDRPKTGTDQLATLSLDQLTRLAAQLQDEVEQQW